MVEGDVRYITTAALGIALDQSGTAEKPGACISCRHHRGCTALRRITWLGPVGEECAKVRERITERTHIPIEDRNKRARIIMGQHDVVELIIVVHERCRAFRW